VRVAALALAWLTALAVSGCAALRPDPARNEAQAMAVSDIVAEAVQTAAASPAEQRNTVERARALLERTHAPSREEADDAGRVRLAALLATLPATDGQRGQAIALLAPVAQRFTDTPLGRFAALLAATLREHERLAAALKESQERADGADRRIYAMRQQIDALKAAERGILERADSADRRVTALRQQLDALKAAERGILEREEKLRATKK